MKKKLEYTVIRDEADYYFFHHVRNLISEGWEPLGGVQIVKDPESGYQIRYYQTMIRRTRKPWWRFWK